jgi:hypothetical protein
VPEHEWHTCDRAASQELTEVIGPIGDGDIVGADVIGWSGPCSSSCIRGIPDADMIDSSLAEQHPACPPPHLGCCVEEDPHDVVGPDAGSHEPTGVSGSGVRRRTFRETRPATMANATRMRSTFFMPMTIAVGSVSDPVIGYRQVVLEER